MADFLRGSLENPGRWELGKANGKETALVSCFKCGKGMSLAAHTIDEKGIVTPSLVCPHGCGFHEMVKLDGWEFRAQR